MSHMPRFGSCLYVSLPRWNQRFCEGSRGNGGVLPHILSGFLVKATKRLPSQCRGRGFESHHLHLRPRSPGWRWESPKDITPKNGVECL
jgi:hypothetical protein